MLLILGGKGYLGSNFFEYCLTTGIEARLVDSRNPDWLSSVREEIEAIVDFSMPNRRINMANPHSFEAFTVNYEKVLKNIIQNQMRLIRITSAFDIAEYYRKDLYTATSKKISNMIRSRYQSDNFLVVYCHALYGGINSTSFIDQLALDSDLRESDLNHDIARDYIFIEDFCEWLIQAIETGRKGEVEIGTAKPYLNSSIRHFLKSKQSTLNNVQIGDPSLKNLILKSRFCSLQGKHVDQVTQAQIIDRLPEYLTTSLKSYDLE